MAQTGVASARAAGHAARLAVHAASGLAWSAGLTDAGRCLRAAEGAVRAALAQLHSPPLWHQGAGETAEEEVAQQQESAPRRRRRKKRRATCGPQQPVVGEEAAADCMEVDPPAPPGEQQELQLEQESAEEPVTGKAGEEEPDENLRREEAV